MSRIKTVKAVKTTALLVGGVILVAGGYQIGRLNGGASTKNATTKSTTAPQPETLQEIAELKSAFDQQQAALGNRIADVQNRIKTVKLNLDLNETDNKMQATRIAEQLAALEKRLLEMNTTAKTPIKTTAKKTGTRADVPFPSDSPAGQLQTQPRADSGIAVSVLQNYTQETGISSDEIESLMRRTE